jgi:plasmid maintenance system antidote protein VapI
MRGKTPTATFDGQLMAEDMAAKGLNRIGLAKRAKVADMTVIRFLRGDIQTPTTALKLAKALGHPVRRYIVSSETAVA